ncbi:MAG TPA: signal peptidase II [Kofleriaceae bacterium]|nr:signal peptidase II [Kofleriaceae bacterium]
MPKKLGRAVMFLAIFFCTTGFDQASKEWARTLPPGVRQPVIDGYWDWELAKNPGAAFSSFTGVTGAQILLSILAAAALIGIGIVAARTGPEEKLKLAGLALIGGGALGNLIDRVREGAVTDFVRWRVHEHLWPIFNVADAALLVGVVLLLLESAVRKRGRAMLKA